MVRRGTKQDVTKCILLGHTLYKESDFFGTGYAPEKLLMFAGQVLSNPDQFCFFVYEKDSEIVGFFVGQITSYYFSNSVYAKNLIWYVLPEHRGTRAAYALLKAYEAWAKTTQASEIQISQSTAIDSAKFTKALRKRGYFVTGNVLTKDL